MSNRALEAEFHDAKLSNITVGADGDISIDFRHIVVNIRTPDAKTETWSYAGRLRLLRATHFSVEGLLDQRDYVSEGALRDALGKRVALADAIDLPGVAGTLELLLAGSGSMIRSSFGAHSFTDLRPIRFLESLE